MLLSVADGQLPDGDDPVDDTRAGLPAPAACSGSDLATWPTADRQDLGNTYRIARQHPGRQRWRPGLLPAPPWSHSELPYLAACTKPDSMTDPAINSRG